MNTFRGHLAGEMEGLAQSDAQNLDDDCGSNNESGDDPVSSSSSQEQFVAGFPKDRASMNDGEVTVADLPREHFVIGDEVFCRRLPHHTAKEGKGVHAIIQGITSNAKSPLLYNLEEINPEHPWKSQSYLVEAADLIPISKTGLSLPTFDIGTTVLVRYPATACLYQAEVLSYHDGAYVVEFQGDDRNRQAKVEKRFVVAKFGPPVSREAWANRNGVEAMLNVVPSSGCGTDTVPDASHMFHTQRGDLHRYIVSALQQQGSYSGWQASAEVELRVNQVKLLNDALLLIKPIIERARAVQVSLSFEQKAFRQSMSQEAYERMCEEKLVQIHDMRRQQLNDGDTAHGLTKPLAMGPGPQASYTAIQPHKFDTTGQVAPPGMKPRVTATLWEEEGTLCFQVESNAVCVARREDNHMINGTKLLNVAGMARGRRDGILKSEKLRHIVKIGPIHLKGVWIAFERALHFANEEKITESLYPLFVHNIGSLLYRPEVASQQQQAQPYQRQMQLMQQQAQQQEHQQQKHQMQKMLLEQQNKKGWVNACQEGDEDCEEVVCELPYRN